MFPWGFTSPFRLGLEVTFLIICYHYDPKICVTIFTHLPDSCDFFSTPASQLVQRLLVQQTLAVVFNITSVELTPEILNRIDPRLFLPPTTPSSTLVADAVLPNDSNASNDTIPDCFQRTLSRWEQLDLRAYIGEFLNLLLTPSDHPEFVIAFVIVIFLMTTPITVFCCLIRQACHYVLRPRIMEVSRPCNRPHFPVSISLPPSYGDSDQDDIESHPDSPSDSMAGNPPSARDIEMEDLSNPLSPQSPHDPNGPTCSGAPSLPVPAIPTPPPPPPAPLVPPGSSVLMLPPSKLRYPMEPASRGP